MLKDINITAEESIDQPNLQDHIKFFNGNSEEQSFKDEMIIGERVQGRNVGTKSNEAEQFVD